MANLWAVPKSRCVSRADARANLSALIQDVRKTNKDVFIGATQKSALCAFISISEYTKDVEEFPHGVADIDLEDLRTNWAQKRNLVENTGICFRVLKKGVPIVALVPTSFGYKRNIDPVRDTIEKGIRQAITEEFIKSQLSSELEQIKKTVAELRSSLKDVQEATNAISDSFLSPEEMLRLKQLLAMVSRDLEKWREFRGHPPTPLAKQGPSN